MNNVSCKGFTFFTFGHCDVVAFSVHERILEEGSINHSLPVHEKKFLLDGDYLAHVNHFHS